MEIFRIPVSKSSFLDTIGVDILAAILGSLYLALSAQFSLWIPFSPVPASMQTFAVFTLAGTLGAKRSTYAVLAYLLEGTFGWPVFAGGMMNPLWFLGPKAGYLFGFVIAAFVVGKLLEKYRSSLWKIALSIMIGQLIIYSCGMTVLSFFVGIPQAFFLGVYPFLWGAVCKLTAATCSLKLGYRLSSC